MSTNYDYLDLLEKINKKLDPKQRAVCCRTDNTIVAAGAGSGKTQVLATRFAWLVMSCNIPASKILTLTFTKKAAGEMYRRIYETLSFFVAQEETPAEEKKRAADALEDFSNVHIQTLDSYCKHIVEQAATRYGITPDFSVGSSDSESDIKNQALPFVFTNRNSSAVSDFATIGNFQNFADGIISNTIIRYSSLAASPSYFCDKLQAQKKELVRAWNYLIFGNTAGKSTLQGDCSPLLKEDLSEKLKDAPLANCLRNAFDLFRNEFNNTKGKTGTPYYSNCEKALDAMENLDFNQLSLDDSFDFENPDKQKLALITAFFRAVSLFDFSQSLGGYTKELRATVKPIKEVFLPYINALSSYITNYKSIKNLQELFDNFKNQINAQKRTSGKLTFKDVSELSLEILINNKDIRQQEKNAYDKIMIDEFQDNNGKNRDLLFLLSEKDFSDKGEEHGCKDGIPSVENIRPDKLFFVGDEKQSIYKFRGAEVSVFNELKHDLGEKNFLQMEYNYRSDNELITSFNRLFGKNDYLFDSRSDKNYEAKYEKFAVKYDPKNQLEVPEEKLTLENIRLHACLLNADLIDSDDLLDEKNQNAYFIAKKIYQLKNTVRADGTKPSFSEFAILDKSRHRTQLLQWLNFFGISYQLDQNSDLFSEGPINDIYAFLRLCVYPSDKNAFASFLASPFCCLNQQALESVLASASLAELPDSEAQLALTAEELLCECSQTQKERFISGIFYIKNQRKAILSQPLAKTVSTLWIETGYQYATMENTKTDLYAEQFDFLFELARQSDQNQKNISWFVDQLAIVKDKEKNSMEEEEIDVAEISYPLEKQDAVQIMTIHKSKGLQFNYVFVCGCISARSGTDRDAVFFDEDFGASIKPASGAGNYFSIIQRLAARKKDIAEFRRLIYVAITRAIREVYIVGKWSPVPKKSQKTDNNEENFKLLEKCIKFYYPETESDGNFALREEKLSSIESVPFSYTSITPVTKKEAYKSSDGKTASPATKIFAPLPADVEEIPYEEPESNRRTPSSLEPEFTAPAADITNSTPDVLLDQKYDSPDDKLDSAAFTAADFGTLVHDYLRAQAEGTAPEVHEPAVKLFKQLTEKEKASNKADCIGMCHDFSASDFGKAAYNSDSSARATNRLLKAEWAFRMAHEGYIWTGSIDLIYENADGTYTIVDYKSDSEIAPERYTAQQNCYRIAASKLLGISEDKITCYLWYLRHNKAVRI
ncbi:MAG: UvrD-helicase domain-containing protein [Treponema sp.]|nr:UvrD-helicase domain-containing protein [Treponema sp.]